MHDALVILVDSLNVCMFSVLVGLICLLNVLHYRYIKMIMQTSPLLGAADSATDRVVTPWRVLAHHLPEDVTP